MEIITCTIEEPLIIIKNEHTIKLTAYLSKTEHCIDLGVAAPRAVAVDREEIYHRKAQKAASE